jgi:hypothetical protein
MGEIKMNDPDLREIASALRYLAGREDECGSNRRKWGEIAAAIEEQVKPAIEEPTEWGSVVAARRVGYGSEDTTRLRWQRWNSIGDSWRSEPAGDLGVVYHSDWSYLTGVEVLRIGVGA